MFGSSDEQLRGYQEYLGGTVIEGNDPMPQEPNMYIVDATGHMKIVGPDLSSGLFGCWEASRDNVKNGPYIRNQQYDHLLNISSPETLRKLGEKGRL